MFDVLQRNGISNPYIINDQVFQSSLTTSTPLIAKGILGQTADIFSVQNSLGSTLFSVSPTGNVTIAGSISAVVNEVITGSLDLTGNLTVSGVSTLNGNIFLGDAATDTLLVNATSSFNGNVTARHDLTVNGILYCLSSSVFDGALIIDVTSTEALLVRKNNDGGDVFTVDTSASIVTANNVKMSTDGIYSDTYQITITGGISTGAKLTLGAIGQTAYGFQLIGGTSNSADNPPGDSTITARTPFFLANTDANAAGGDIRMSGTDGTTGGGGTRNGRGGDLFLWGGAGAGTGRPGAVVLSYDKDGSTAQGSVFVGMDAAVSTYLLNVAGSTLLDVNTNVIALDIDSEATTADIINIQPNTITQGIIIDAQGANALTSGKFVNLTSTRSGAALGDRTADYFTLSVSREETQGGGATTADDYDLMSITRTSILNGASILTEAGSVLKLSNVPTYTSGTITDTVSVLEIVQNAPSTGTGSGAGIQITMQGATGSGIALDINYSQNSYTSGVGSLIDLVRSGNLTLDGGGADVLQDFRIAPSFTLTEGPLAGASYYLANIDASGISVTSGAGGSTVAALRVAESTDADINTSYAIWCVGEFFLDQNSDKIALDIDSEATTADIINIQPDTLTTGNIIDASGANALTDGQFLNFTHTRSANNLGDRSNDWVTFNVNRTETRTSGTTTSDENNWYFNRVDTMNGAGGAYTIQGDGFLIRHVLTNTAGTLTNASNLLSLVRTNTGTVAYTQYGNVIDISTEGAQLISASHLTNIYIDAKAAGMDFAIQTTFTGVSGESSCGMRLYNNGTITEPASGTFTYDGLLIDLSGISVTAGDGTSVFSTLHLKAATDADIGTRWGLWIEGATKSDGAFVGKQGTDIASSSTIVIPRDGNVFELTGTTAVNLITITGYQDGHEITLIANENVTINNGTATSGSDVTILLASASNFAMTANDTLTLVLSSTTAGGQAWREKARTAI